MSWRSTTVVTLMVLSSSHCTSAPPADQARRTIKVTTGMAGASFQPLGTGLVEVFARRIPDVDFAAVETAGSVSNLEALQSGEADVGLAYADVAYMAYTGLLPDDRRPFRELRAVAVLHVSPVHVLVRSDSRIKSIAELRGRRVGIGPPGSGTALTSTLLLEAFDVPLDSTQQHSLPFTDAADGLTRGDLDAVVVVSADPVESVQRAIDGGARLLDIDSPTVTRLRDNYPFLRPALIPERTYQGLPDTVHTVGIDTLLVGRAGVSDTLATEITRAFFEALPELGSRLESFLFVDPDRAPATPIPLHAGAARYYRERELFR